MEAKKGNRLLRILARLHIDAKDAAEFLAQNGENPVEENEGVNVESTPTEDEVVEEAQATEATPVETVEDEPQPTEPVEEPVEEVNEPIEEVDTPTEKPIATPEEPIEEPVVEQPVEEPEEPITPVEPPVEESVEPAVDEKDAKIADLESKVEELQNTFDGLKAQVTSLIENITKSGLIDIEEEQKDVGIDENTVPAREQQSNISDILTRINSGRKY